MEVSEHMGPITVLLGEIDDESIKLGAAITARYSDAPKNEIVEVVIQNETSNVIKSGSITDEELDLYRI